MPTTIPQPSQLINCSDLSSCFQAIYNLLFAIFVALAFLYFLFGAFQYLLSGGGVFSKEQARSKMRNSIIALIIVLVIPIILNLINPGIFRGIKISIPKVTVTMPQLNVETDPNAYVVSTTTPGFHPSAYYRRGGPLSQYICFTSNPIYASVLPKMANYQCCTVHALVADQLENCVKNKLKGSGTQFLLTQGYNPNSFDKSHKLGYGIDILPIPNSTLDYNRLLDALVSCGFTVINESGTVLNCNGSNLAPCPEECKGNSLKPGCSCAWTGPHFHAALEVR